MVAQFAGLLGITLLVYRHERRTYRRNQARADVLSRDQRRQIGR